VVPALAASGSPGGGSDGPPPLRRAPHRLPAAGRGPHGCAVVEGLLAPPCGPQAAGAPRAVRPGGRPLHRDRAWRDLDRARRPPRSGGDRPTPRARRAVRGPGAGGGAVRSDRPLAGRGTDREQRPLGGGPVPRLRPGRGPRPPAEHGHPVREGPPPRGGLVRPLPGGEARDRSPPHRPRPEPPARPRRVRRPRPRECRDRPRAVHWRDAPHRPPSPAAGGLIAAGSRTEGALSLHGERGHRRVRDAVPRRLPLLLRQSRG